MDFGMRKNTLAVVCYDGENRPEGRDAAYGKPRG